MEKKSLIADFTQGNITKQLIWFSMPVFISSLLQITYNMVDMIIVGNVLGKEGLSGVTIGGDVVNLLTFVAIGFGIAGQVIISQYVGAKQYKKIGRFVSTMFTVLILCAIFLSTLCFILREPILDIMNTPIEARREALEYSVVSIIGMVFIYGYNIISSVLRGLGDSKHPLMFIFIATVLNIVLDIVFVVFMDLHSMGAALATIIAQGVSFIWGAIFMYRTREQSGLDIKFRDFFHPDKSMTKLLLKLGVPMAIKSASIQFSKVFVNAWINSYGVVISAFSGAANKLINVSNIVAISINTAGASMVGQNIGARTFERVPKIMLNTFYIVLGFSILMSAAIMLFPEQIFSIFTDDEEVLAIAALYVPIAIVQFMSCAARAPMNTLINGSGDVSYNFATAILDGVVMRIGFSLVLGLVFNMEYTGFWLGDALAGFTPLFLGIVLLVSGKWKRESV